MGRRIIKAIEWVLMEFEARLVTFMIWLCWVCGISSDEVERHREEQKAKLGSASMTNNPPPPPKTADLSQQPPNRRPSHGT